MYNQSETFLAGIVTEWVVRWAHGSLIFNYGGCPMSPWEFNIQLWRMSNEPMGVQYSTMEDVRWAHESLIFNYRGCPLGP
jgi:hypothetical protein